MTEPTAELLDRADRVTLQATGEPWTTLPLAGANPTTAIERPCPGGAATPVGKAWAPEDASFIAAARTLVPELAGRLRLAVAVVDKLDAEIERMQELYEAHSRADDYPRIIQSDAHLMGLKWARQVLVAAFEEAGG